MVMQIEEIRIDEISNHPSNPKIHPEKQIRLIQESIKKFGYTNPVILSADNIILAGHARVKAAIELGQDTIPCIRTKLSGAEADAYLLTDNRLSDIAPYDRDILAELLSDIPKDLVEITGFDQIQIDALLSGEDIPDIDKFISDSQPEEPVICEPDEFTEPEKIKTDIKYGDVIKIENIILVCGDSTDNQIVTKLLNGIIPDLLFFDPPYESRELWNCGIQTPKTIVFSDSKHIRDAMTIAMRYSYIYEFVWDTILSWYVENRPICRHRSAFVCLDTPGYNSDACVINDGKPRKPSKRTTNLGTYTYEPMDEGLVRLTTVFQYGKNKLPAEHGKPIEWITPLIAGCNAQSVIDPFAGSGATAIACIQLGIPCFLIEKSPEKCQLISDRIYTYLKR